VRALTLGDAIERMNQLVLAMAAFNGLSLENMTRGQGWRFTDLGRRLERSLFLLTVFQHTMVTPCRDEQRPDETRLLEALLETADSAITYRRRYLGTVQPAPVLDLLATDETNPRALVFRCARRDTSSACPRRRRGARTRRNGRRSPRWRGSAWRCRPSSPRSGCTASASSSPISSDS
jgi:uncharacterized alpha-E superfamily protein